MDQRTRVPERRRFFQRMASDLLSLADEVRGRPQLKLGDLGDLPDAALGALAPMILPGTTITVDGDRVWAQRPDDEAPVGLFDCTEANAAAFNGFNGHTPLSDVARQTAEALGWPVEQAFAHVRGLFLELVRARVCVPANPGEEPA